LAEWISLMTDWAGRVQRLEAEVSGLRRAMRSRGLIEQAKGRLAERWGVDAERAFAMLSQQSQETNVRVVDVAAEIMGSPVPADADATSVVGPPGGPGAGWIEPLVDVLEEPVIVLSPLWTNETLADFRIDYANPAGVRRWGLSGGSPEGRRLVDTAPELVIDGTVEVLARVFRGEPVGDPGRVRAARIGDRLIATWSAAPPPADASWIEELGGLGWGRWSRTSAALEFSLGLYRVLDRDPANGPLSLDQVIALFAPADRHRARGLVGGAAPREVTGGSMVEVSVARTGRRLRMHVPARQNADAAGDGDVLALFQDVTESRKMSAAVDRLAARQLHAAVERAQTEHLRCALFPAPLTRTGLGEMVILARHAAPAEIGRFRGDFYEICRARRGLTVIVGDIFGSGIDAATTMVRIRHAARALALAELAPAEILRLLNAELCSDGQPPLASLVVAILDADGQTMRWAQAGHFSPVMIRRGRARALRRPRGSVVGLLPDTGYSETSVRLRMDDLVVLYTDGVFQRWEPEWDRPRRLAAECVQAKQEGGAEAVMRRLLRPAGDEACVVAIEA
jgi:serine phosphatase RsbU (regulator of sigma subunit)